MNIINLGILAHVDAGKTTLTESILYLTGILSKKGRVDDGTTISDSMELEQKRGMSIRSSTVSFTHKNVKVNLIDTPGHMDFIAEVERSLTVIDLVILVLSAKEGVQPQTRVIFHKLQELKIPTILFINKIDRMGVDLQQLYKEIKKQLTTKLILFQDVLNAGSKEFKITDLNYETSNLQEQILLHSDRLLENYTDDIPINNKDYENEFKDLFNKGDLYPIFHGSALMDLGTKTLLDSIVTIYQSKMFETEELSAYVYKIEWDSRGHKRIYIRIFEGVLIYRQRVCILGQDDPITITALRKVQDGHVLPTDHLIAGDIGILLDIDQLKCGDFIGKKTSLVNAELAKPLLTVSVSPRDPGQRSSLIYALKQLTAEDPFLEMKIHPVTNEIMLKLFGKLQIEILSSLLINRYHIDSEFSGTKTVYKEQPVEPSTATIWVGESGNLYHAGVSLTIEPMELGSGFLYENKVSYGYLEKPFQNAVLEGIKAGLSEGLNQQEIIDSKVIFEDAYYDSVCGTPSDFRKLTPMVIQKALETAGLRELEPWQFYTLSAPTGYEKSIIADIFKMNGTVENVTYENDDFQVTGTIPYDTSKDYAVNLLSMTEGKGIFQTKFYKYLPR
jgi:ribosomal protection tetracycline resistance protein